MKKLLSGLALSLTLLSPAIFASKDAEGNNLSIIESIVQKNLGRDVAFKFRPRMLGMTGVRLENFRISEDEEYLKTHPYLGPWAVQASSVDVNYNPFAIFVGRISLNEVKLRNPTIQISVDSRFHHNFEDILAKQKTNRFSNWIHAHHINIDNMHWDIYSELIFAEPVTYQVRNINVDINNVAKGKVASIDISARTPGAPRDNVNIDGTIGPIISIARIEESPMNIVFSVKDAPMDFEIANIPESIKNDRRYRRTLALPESGFSNIDYKLTGGVWERLDIDGVITIEDMVFASIDKTLKGKPFNVKINSQSNFSLKDQTSNLEDIAIAINTAKLSLKGKISQILDNPQAELHLYSNTINLAEFNDIYPFVADIYKIELHRGTTEMDLRTSGNLKEGLALNGYLKTKNLQLASLKDGRKGGILNSSIELTKPIIYYGEENRLNFEQIDLNLANSRIKLDGNMTEATSITRKLLANIESKALDISAFHNFMPFYDEYLPDEFEYGGFFSFKAQAEGNLNYGTLSGKADLSKTTFRIQNFARKTKTSRFDADYTASLNEEGKFEAEASFVLEDGALDNSVVYLEGLRFLLGGEHISQAGLDYIKDIDPESILFAKASGNLKLVNQKALDLKMNVKNIHNQRQSQVDLYLDGTLQVEDYTMNLKGQLHIPKASADSIISINPKAVQFLSTDKNYLILPLNITGKINDPKIRIAS